MNRESPIAHHPADWERQISPMQYGDLNVSQHLRAAIYSSDLYYNYMIPVYVDLMMM